MRFAEQMKLSQIEWRRRALKNQVHGRQNKRTYEHILPDDEWELNLWEGIAEPLAAYLRNAKIQHHTGTHNLCSSWIVCANLYFPFRTPSGREMLLGFLRDHISSDLTSVTGIELEYEDPAVPPSALGETGGRRGSGQTSPDVAFKGTTSAGRGVVLVECKFVEHSFYSCSGRKKEKAGEQDRDGRPRNPDPSRCKSYARVLENPATECHLVSPGWNRQYWKYLQPIADRSVALELATCPAAFGGYQLMRQHALAQAIATRSAGTLVVSSVAYDERNVGLMRCMARSTGVKDIREDWARLFRGEVVFKTFTHQSWVAWVSNHDSSGEWYDWLQYVRKRYAF